jgi:hypothetical protein
MVYVVEDLRRGSCPELFDSFFVLALRYFDLFVLLESLRLGFLFAASCCGCVGATFALD